MFVCVVLCACVSVSVFVCVCVCGCITVVLLIICVCVFVFVGREGFLRPNETGNVIGQLHTNICSRICANRVIRIKGLNIVSFINRWVFWYYIRM